MVACGYPKHSFSFAFITSLFSSGKQHIRCCVALGDELNPHPKMVETILRPEPGVEKTVLDLG